ncbi:MliC family protein [Pseudotabrizicola algicola]|uniref:Lysozyme inhibitor n=1 Tax=Pseudotabrizicola algicola TaxID=2709381 RepID=A0A6B3RKF3_9RHOB|nr:MliC family protein [Pseudotabrizicola algicola]NEX44885.1 lysozyme inhibitor [Pseudotabrizicola algicola]
MRRRIAPVLAVVAGVAAGAQVWAAPLEVNNIRLTCDRDVVVPVTFVTGPEDAVAVMQIDGGQFLLYQEPAASGARYAWPSGGASYVLWTKGDQTTILWREAGAETVLLTCTREM